MFQLNSLLIQLFAGMCVHTTKDTVSLSFLDFFVLFENVYTNDIIQNVKAKIQDKEL